MADEKRADRLARGRTLVLVDSPEGLAVQMCSECEIHLADGDTDLCCFCSFNDLGVWDDDFYGGRP